MAGREVPFSPAESTATGRNQCDPAALVERIPEKKREYASDPKWGQEGIPSALLGNAEEKSARRLPHLPGVAIENASDAIPFLDACEEGGITKVS